MKKVLLVIALCVTFLSILTGCDFGSANDDYNIHIKDDSVIAIKDPIVVKEDITVTESEGEYRQVKTITAYRDYTYNGGTIFSYEYSSPDYKCYYNSKLKIIKVIGTESGVEDIHYIELISACYVSVKYSDNK